MFTGYTWDIKELYWLHRFDTVLWHWLLLNKALGELRDTVAREIGIEQLVDKLAHRLNKNVAPRG